MIVLAALVGSALLWLLGLRDFTFTDYEAEAKPAIDRFLAGDLGGYMDAMPGYAGAVMIQTPFAWVGNVVGPDHDLWAWRAQAIPGLALLACLGIALGRKVAEGMPGRRGVAWGSLTALLIAGAPFGLLALQTGHTEELLVAGLSVAAVWIAAGGRVVPAAALIGAAAAAKPWAVIAVPVVLLASSDWRTLTRAFLACLVAGLIVTAPSLISGGTSKVQASTHSSTSGIFKPDNVFWFAGRENPRWEEVRTAKVDQLFQRDPTMASWAQRLEPSWAARASHPLIVAFAGFLALAFWRLRVGKEARQDLLLLLAAVCWWRCLLDTWNVHYYALGALVAMAAWEATRGRPPVLSSIVTTLAWTSFQIFPASDLTPDVHTAIYLTWGLPLGLGLVMRLLAPTAFARLSTRVTSPLAVRLPTLARVLRSEPVT